MDIQSLVQAQRSHFQTGAALGLTARRTALKRLGEAIRAHEGDISAALLADLAGFMAAALAVRVFFGGG